MLSTRVKEHEARTATTSLIIGYVAIGVVVTIWASFALSIRAISTSPLNITDVALIRFGAPTLLLLPLLPSRWQALRRVRALDAFMVLIGAGLPFFWIAAKGGAETSAAHVSALIAGTVPVSVALLSFVLYRKCFSARQLSGLFIIALGVMALVMSQSLIGHGSAWKGTALLLTASLLWGTYTLGLKQTGLDAVGSTLLLTMPSFVVLIAIIAVGAIPTPHLVQLSFNTVFPFVIVQGLGVGLAASFAYATAISRLGATRSAIIGSLAPTLAAIAAVPLLGEMLTPSISLGVAAITTGVILANHSR